MKTSEARALIGRNVKFIFPRGMVVYGTVAEVVNKNARVTFANGGYDWLYLPDVATYQADPIRRITQRNARVHSK